jgi:hypothetical protein
MLRSALVLILSACDPVSSLDDQRVWRWMECLECRAFELDSVVALGDTVVPLLSQILANGPPPERIERMRQGLDSNYNTLSYVPGIAGLDSAQWVDQYLASYSNTYKGRAAWALGQIGGAPARQSLDAALSDTLTPSLRAQVRYVIDSVLGARPDPAEFR